MNLLTEHHNTENTELQAEKAQTERLIANKVEVEQDSTVKLRQTPLDRVHATELKRKMAKTRMLNERRRKADVNELKPQTSSSRKNHLHRPYETSNDAHGNNTKRT